MASYELSILTPQGETFSGPVEFLLISGQLGELGVLANHAPVIVALKKGILKLRNEAGEKFFSHESGVLEVKPNHNVLVLVDDAAPATGISSGKATSAH